MYEIRQNKITRKWVIYSAARAKRPHDFSRDTRGEGDLPTFAPDCPFCPGNEQMTPPAIIQIPGENGNWQTRVFSNKFPILGPGCDGAGANYDVYRTVPGIGRHEVIVETPLHNQDIPFMSLDHVGAVIEAYHRRYTDLLADDTIETVFLFRNHGASAGTSLIHPHSQIVAASVVPPHIQERITAAVDYWETQGQCGFCDTMAFESAEGRRIVWENDSFLAFVPFAAETAWETWIMPRRHQANFGNISDVEKNDLAEILHEILLRLHKTANNPDYNYIIHTPPKEKLDAPYLHWYIQVRPRTGIEAGFEMGSGMSVNASYPEEDARLLRETIGKLPD